MRSYHVTTVAVALSCPSKWVDNVLSRHELPGVIHQRQGISRQVSFDGVVHLAIVQELVEEVGLPVERAVRFARVLCADDGVAPAGVRCALHIDLHALRRDLTIALREAVEIASPPRRGRPLRRRAAS